MVVGIDVHKDSHTAALVDERGREVESLRIENSSAGAKRLLTWLSEQGADAAPIGVENAACYGRLVAAELIACGRTVLDVPAHRTQRERSHSGPGKSDRGDAVAIARVVLGSGAELRPALEPELVRAFRALDTLRRQSVSDRTRTAARLRALWAGFDPDSERATDSVVAERAIRRLKRIRLGDGLAAACAGRCLRELARQLELLNRRVEKLDAELGALLREHGDPVRALPGAGPVTAASLVAQAGDVRRFRSPAAFARYCGVAPLACGSGRTAERHRLDRGGNRQLNAALHRIAITQARVDPRAQAFLARKRAEGKTKREARRALKRHLANAVYRHLERWAETSLLASTA